MRFIRTTTLLATLACISATAVAQQGSREAFYRCKDASGQTHYGDRKPPQCEGLDTEVLSDRGTLLRIMEGAQTRAAREQREAVEAKAQKQREERLQRDRMLIETYLSVEDIERLRDQRLELLDSKYRVTEQNIRNLQDRQGRLEAQIARFKPYNDKPGAPPLPDHLGEEIVNMVNSMRVYEETLAKTRGEQNEIKASFDADIKRFKELKGIK